jgi:hypothetical protein
MSPAFHTVGSIRRSMEGKTIKIRHAPWSKWLKTFYVNGSFAHEVQIGPAVVQWFHKPWERAKLFGRLHFWRDMYWRR